MRAAAKSIHFRATRSAFAAILWAVIIGGCTTTPPTTSKATRPVTVEDFASVADQLKMVTDQLLNRHSRLHDKVENSVTSLDQAWLAVSQKYPKVTFYEMVEHKGWFIFSECTRDSGIRFHSGYAIRKDSKEIVYWGFW